MKKVIVFFVAILVVNFAGAQTPQAFKYQTQVRDNAGNLLANQTVSFRISLIRGPQPGITDYVEVHSALTNDFGLANLIIGRGTPISGDFLSIDWTEIPYFIKTEIDTSGGSSYIDMGTSELLSVPYALYAVGLATNVLSDTDGDTKVQVEKNSDEDIIRFDMNGQEYWKMNGEKLESTGEGRTVLIGKGAGEKISATQSNNVFIGYEAGFENLLGSNNTAVGFMSLHSNTNRSENTAFGMYSLFSNSEGESNTVSGSRAMQDNISGTSNTANGSLAMRYNQTGWYNTALGYEALYENISGSRNTAVGTGALSFNKVDNNTAVGYFSLGLNTNGGQNTAIGYETLKNNSDGEQNTALGYHALHSNINGDFNTASGCKSLYSNTSGTYNTAVGLAALFSNTSGNYNLAAGFYSLLNNDTGSENSGLGHGALQNNVAGYQNTATGAFALYQNSTGSRNTSLGYMAGALKTSNEKCTFIGYQADANGNVINSTAIGSGAMINDNNQVRLGNDSITSLFCKGAYVATTTNIPNLFVDANGQIMRSTAALSVWSLAGNSILTGQFLGTTNDMPLEIKTNGTLRARITTKGQIEILNTGQSVFIGEGAGENDDLSSNSNVFVGFYSGKQTTGANNTALGYCTLRNNTLGVYNTAVGFFSLYQNTVGLENTALGSYSLHLLSLGDINTAVGAGAMVHLSSGYANTAIGASAGGINNSYNNCTFIGHNSDASSSGYSNASALGNNATVTGSNYIRIGNTSVTQIGGEVGWTTLSDERVKYNVSENVIGLDFIMKLQPVTYNLDKNKQDQIIGREDKSDYPEKYDIEKIRFSGFSAQEVEKAAQEVGYDFSGVKKPANEKDLYGLTYGEFTVPIVKAIQEQQKIIEELKKEIEALKLLVDQK